MSIYYKSYNHHNICQYYPIIRCSNMTLLLVDVFTFDFDQSIADPRKNLLSSIGS